MVKLKHALSFAKAEGYTQIELRTHHNMKRAHSFYEKHRFQKIGETDEGFLYGKMI